MNYAHHENREISILNFLCNNNLFNISLFKPAHNIISTI